MAWWWWVLGAVMLVWYWTELSTIIKTCFLQKRLQCAVWLTMFQPVIALALAIASGVALNWALSLLS